MALGGTLVPCHPWKPCCHLRQPRPIWWSQDRRSRAGPHTSLKVACQIWCGRYDWSQETQQTNWWKTSLCHLHRTKTLRVTPDWKIIYEKSWFLLKIRIFLYLLCQRFPSQLHPYQWRYFGVLLPVVSSGWQTIKNSHDSKGINMVLGCQIVKGCCFPFPQPWLPICTKFDVLFKVVWIKKKTSEDKTFPNIRLVIPSSLAIW